MSTLDAGNEDFLTFSSHFSNNCALESVRDSLVKRGEIGAFNFDGDDASTSTSILNVAIPSMLWR